MEQDGIDMGCEGCPCCENTDAVSSERDKIKAEAERLQDRVSGLEKLPDALRDSLDKSDEDRHRLKAENKRLHELVQEVIDHDETTAWGQNKLAAALKRNEPETKTVAVPAGQGYEAPIAGIAEMKRIP